MTGLLRVLAIVALLVVGAAACAQSPPTSLQTRVEIDIEIEGGRTWSASSRSVDAGLICEGGSHRWIGYRMHDGSPIGYAEASALKRLEPALVLIETQLGCSDGTGAISIAWEPEEDDRWIVVGGTGAYRGATGGGRVEESGDPGRPVALRGEFLAK